MPERREAALMAAVTAVMLTACLSLTRVYIGLAFLRPVLAAVVLSLAVSFAARRGGLGPLSTLAASAAAWALFVSLAFFGDTLVLGLLPTRATLDTGWELWLRGIELLRLRPTPTFAEAGLLLITVTGIWAVAHAVEGLVFRIGAPFAAIAMALILWVVPLTLGPDSSPVWPWTVPFLLAAGGLLLNVAGADLARWGRWVQSRPALRWHSPSGWVMTGLAVLFGVLFAGLLPGYGDPPWYQLRMLGGTTLTTNPIVDIRPRLVAQDQGPVLTVHSPRAVYLKVTSLDLYSDTEEWTNAGIRGVPLPDDGSVPPEVQVPHAEIVTVRITVEDLPGAVLVPSPYQPAHVDGPVAQHLQYDASLSTLTLDRGASLEPGDTYAVVAAIPAPPAEALERLATATVPAHLTALPEGVPPTVSQLAQEIVSRAGASTPFAQALAIQNELRSWDYSLAPPQGHSGTAMESFLATRTGYCEQFAGTMAVMLRTLGVPARVAVGYGPGQLVDPTVGEWSVSNANAHAWVEVLFPGFGWMSFEPTPRSDGNVIVPGPANLAPAATVAQELDVAQLRPPDPEDVEFIPQPGPDPDVGGPRDGEGADAAQSGQGRRGLLILAVSVLAVVLAGIAGATLRARRGPAFGGPGERIRHALRRVQRLGLGLGIPPSPAETDHEYLRRLAGHDPQAEVLATRAAQSRYAPAVGQLAASEAEAAAEALCQRLLAELSTTHRVLARARAPLEMGRAAVTGGLRGLLTRDR